MSNQTPIQNKIEELRARASIENNNGSFTEILMSLAQYIKEEVVPEKFHVDKRNSSYYINTYKNTVIKKVVDKFKELGI